MTNKRRNKQNKIIKKTLMINDNIMTKKIKNKERKNRETTSHI